MKKIFILFLSILFMGCSTFSAKEQLIPSASMKENAGTHMTKIDAQEDLRQLVQLLEQIHPEPYQAFGGRISFYRTVYQLFASIPADGMTREEFLSFVRPLLSAYHDGHTTIHFPAEELPKEKLWLDLDVAGDVLYVSGVYREEDVSLLGSRVTKIEGVSIAQLLKKTEEIKGSDNKYSKFRNFIGLLSSKEGVADLLSRKTGNSLRFEFMSASSKLMSSVQPFLREAPGNRIEPKTLISMPSADSSGLGYGFLDSKKKIALLRLDSSMKYREAFEIWKKSGTTDILDSQLKSLFGTNSHLSVDQQIQKIPSAISLFKQLFTDMKQNQTKTLIIDLRKNGGGNSFLGIMLAYFLVPEKKLLQAALSGYQIRRLSDAYFAWYRNDNIENVRSRLGSYFMPGDYDFSEEGMTFPKTTGSSLSESGYASISSSFQELVDTQEWNATWKPQVFILVSNRTYSAGSDIAELLFKSGASLIGVPSAQAPNCFIEGIGFSLKHSALVGGISYKKTIAFPENKEFGEALPLEKALTYQMLEKFQFDPNATVRLAVKLAMSRSK